MNTTDNGSQRVYRLVVECTTKEGAPLSGWIAPTVALTNVVLGFAQVFYDGAQVLHQFAETRPATSFPHSTLAILPVQLVALGTLGSILGYWLAVRYDWWRRHETAG